MADEQTLFVQGDTDGEYVEYTQPTFTESLGDFAENEHLQGVENLSGLAEAHVKTASELAELKSAHQAPDEYELPTIPEGIPADDKALTDFSALAKEIGLSQEQFNKITQFDIQRAESYLQAGVEGHEKLKEANETALRERWGTDYEKNAEMASAGFRKVLAAFKDGDEIEKNLAASGILDSVEFMRLFRMIGAKTSEDVFVTGTQSSSDQGIPRDTTGKPVLSYPNSNMPGDARQ